MLMLLLMLTTDVETNADAELTSDWLIDHDSGDTWDNSYNNLRLVTRLENARNHKVHRTNKSGVTGVHWKEDDKSWVAKMGVGTKTERFSSKSMEECVAWRLRKEEELGHQIRGGVDWSFLDSDDDEDSDDSDDDMVVTSSLKKARVTNAIIDSDDEL